MNEKVKYAILIVASIILGLTLRYFSEDLPRWVNYMKKLAKKM